MKIRPSESNDRILVVDDNPSIHADFRKILEAQHAGANSLAHATADLFGGTVALKQRAEFKLSTAFQGEEGLAAVQKALAERKPFAMAFMDVRMPPGWDGIETTNRIWEVDPDIQIVICTAYS